MNLRNGLDRHSANSKDLPDEVPQTLLVRADEVIE
jgi:hypothetical protein